MPQILATFNPSAQEVFPIYADDAKTMAVRLGPNLTLAAGTLIAQNNTDNKFYAYANGGANGIGTARLALKHSAKTDANGNVVLGDQTPGEWGQVAATIDAYYCGTFRKGDLTGLDANALTNLGARYLTGGTNGSDDLLRIP